MVHLFQHLIAHHHAHSPQEPRSPPPSQNPPHTEGAEIPSDYGSVVNKKFVMSNDTTSSSIPFLGESPVRALAT